jgi:hypothetical protein
VAQKPATFLAIVNILVLFNHPLMLAENTKCSLPPMHVLLLQGDTEFSINTNICIVKRIRTINCKYENFGYFGTTLTNQSLIQEEIKRRLNSGNVCYHSVQNLLSSRLLSKNVKLRYAKPHYCLWFCMDMTLGL